MKLYISALMATVLVLTGCATGNQRSQEDMALINNLNHRIAELEAQQQALSSQVSRGVPTVPTGITAVPAERRSGVYDDSPINAAAGFDSASTPREMASGGGAADGFDQGLALYRAGDIDNAIGFLAQYVSQGSGDPARVNLARYWLGDAYYTQRRYDDANRFLGLYLREAPNGEKAAAALDKLINSLRAVGRTQDADVLSQYGVQAITGG